jgi:hypothetical protein
LSKSVFGVLVINEFRFRTFVPPKERRSWLGF